MITHFLYPKIEINAWIF